MYLVACSGMVVRDLIRCDDLENTGANNETAQVHTQYTDLPLVDSTDVIQAHPFQCMPCMPAKGSGPGSKFSALPEPPTAEHSGGDSAVPPQTTIMSLS